MDYDMFRTLNLLQENNHYTQRNIAEILGISLGKTNMLLKDLMESGNLHLVINLGKSRYYLTQSGIELKNELNQSFLNDCFNVIFEFKSLVKETVSQVVAEEPKAVLIFLGNPSESTRLLRLAMLELKQEKKIQYQFVQTAEALVDAYTGDQTKVFIWEKAFEQELNALEVPFIQLLTPYYPKRNMDLNFNGLFH